MKPKKILFINTDEELLKKYAYAGYETEVLSSCKLMGAVFGNFQPDFIFVNSMQEAQLQEIRRDPSYAKVPVAVLAESFKDLANLNQIADCPKVLVCNRALAEHPDFMEHVHNICHEQKELPSMSAARSVMYTVLFINKNYSRDLTRTTIANQIGLNPDYLTRIFRQQMGISLWDYLTLYRLHVASRLLLQTSESATQIATKTGFADDAYFCNVFKKRYGCPPGEFRSRL